ncbi:hypothetical protein EYZ11_004841 [Aspergillus tanneri]|uniref:Uncharacterized protein n=1 Tax=Aspergillus tanneri TaxID=1220188 RepID=A0A4V3UPM8_9EURO|nr:hypothetical protein EYZ11_004841 [Aspergillus tanneri]
MAQNDEEFPPGHTAIYESECVILSTKSSMRP